MRVVLRPATRSARARAGRTVRWLLLPLAALALGYLLWPYVTVWRLDIALRTGDAQAFTGLVDIAAVRGEIKKKLNKDAESRIATVSDGFIRWLQQGIKDLGSDAVDEAVTPAWVRGRLLAHTPGVGPRGFLGEVSYAFFESLGRFRFTVGAPDDEPVQVELDLGLDGWQITAVYY